jgi:DNA repair protein RecO (recombination protein O)
MTDWTDQAVVLGARRQGEGSLILSLLTRRQGRQRGLVRGGAKSRQRGAYEPGTLVTATWRARLEEHLGHLQIEPGTSYVAGLLDDPLRLGCLEAAVSLTELTLPEREPHPAAFDGLVRLLGHLDRDDGYAAAHLAWEVALLTELGYGLGLTTCAVTGTTADLAWVSPRTGRAVSQAAGVAYKDKLLVLPRLLGGLGDGGSDIEDLLDGLKLTASFLERQALAPRGQGLPPARTRYVDRLGRLATVSRAPT